jgi:predicted permease
MVNAAKYIVYALRMLGRNPGFTFVAAVTLALGIGATTAIFSVVDGVLIKPLPFRDPDRLAMVWQKSATAAQLGISELDLDDYRSRVRVFEDLGGFTVPGTKSAILTGLGNPVEIAPSYITQNYFSVLGISLEIGRDFLPEECRRGRDHVAILGYSLWQSRFGGSRDILNHPITLNGQTLAVVGVMRRNVYPAEADVFLPFTQVSPDGPMPRNYHELNIVGRLRPGRSVAEAQREMDSLSADLERSYPVTNSGIRADVVPLREEIIGNVRVPLYMLLFAAGLVMTIACGNVVNLVLVRAAARQKEIAIRVAMGAGRNAIVAQFVVECVILSAVGAILGLLLAFWAMPLIRDLGAERIPRLQHVQIDAVVLLFTAGIALLAGLLFGVVAALRYSSSNLNQMLRAGGRTSMSDSGRLRNLLVAGEVALCLVVVVGASLLVRSLDQLLDVHPGFRPDHLLVAQIALPRNHYAQPQVRNFYRRLLPRISTIPGVLSVAASNALPMAAAITQTRFAVKGAPAPEPGRYPATAIVIVDAEFFKVLDIPILRGRTFKPEEVGNPNPVSCIINATLARGYFAGQDPTGHIILTKDALSVTPQDPCEIVGVVGDTHIAGLDEPAMPVLYFATYVAKEMLVVRTATDPLAVAPAVQREVAAADPDQPLSGVRTMGEILSRSLSRRVFAAELLVMFSCLGLVLASLGLYGVVSYSVAQRTQEIGVRMALGAEPESVFRLILWQGLTVTGTGLLVGILAALGATRMMSSLLYGVGAADPFSFAVGCGLLLAVTALACYIPARRATRVDPLVALRWE